MSNASLAESLEAVNAIKTEDAAPEDGRGRRERGPTRLQTFLGTCVPIGLVSYIAVASRLVLVDAIGLWPSPHRELLGITFAISVSVLLAQLVWLITRPLNHAAPPQHPPADISSTVHECDANGQPMTCEWCPPVRGPSTGRQVQPWTPARTRHCRECRSCVTGFDHHCPWIGRCVSSRTYKPFCVFLATVPIAIGIGLVAVAPIAWQGLCEVIRTTWNDEALVETWWSRRRSWAVGPAWRYAYGLVLTYRRYRELRPELDASNSLASPHFGPVLIAAIAILLIGFCVILLGMLLRYTLNGQTTIEVMRSARKSDRRERFVWIPGDGVTAGRVVGLPMHTRLYDLGPRRNFQAAFGSGWEIICPWIAAPNADGLSYEIAVDMISKMS